MARITLTKSQQNIKVRLLKAAKNRNAKGLGYRVGPGYNSNWHNVEQMLIDSKAVKLNTGKGKARGIWVK